MLKWKKKKKKKEIQLISKKILEKRKVAQKKTLINTPCERNFNSANGEQFLSKNIYSDIAVNYGVGIPSLFSTHCQKIEVNQEVVLRRISTLNDSVIKKTKKQNNNNNNNNKDKIQFSFLQKRL